MLALLLVYFLLGVFSCKYGAGPAQLGVFRDMVEPSVANDAACARALTRPNHICSEARALSVSASHIVYSFKYSRTTT